jgi:hypothetical protein
MKRNHPEDREPRRGNVERLLSRTEPELRMPRERKQATLRALLDEAAEGSDVRPGRPERRFVMKTRSWSWLSAAALLLAAVILWPGGLNDGVAWADVVQHLSRAESLIARISLEDTPPSGETRHGFAMLYQRDPGLFRTEVYALREAEDASDGRPVESDAVAQSIMISRGGPREATILRLSPVERVAHRTTLTFAGRLLDDRGAMPRDLVGETWSRLKEVTGDRTRAIGEREIDGVRTIGFETDIRELFRDPSAPHPDGVFRVWAATGSGAPVEAEVEFRDPRGWHHRTRFLDLEWNAPVDDGLFEIPDLEGWTVVEEEDHQLGFDRTRLRGGVTLRIGPPGGPVVFTEADIEAVVSGRVVHQAGRGERHTTVMLTATRDAERRLEAYSAQHPGETLELDFNGEARDEIRTESVLGGEIWLDIGDLGVTPAEFESTYLVP